MKKLFRLGLAALMGVCCLVGIGRAQTVLTVDTAASEENCTLLEDGTWKVVPPNNAFGLVLKVMNGEENTQYKVSYTVKDKDGKDMSSLFSNEMSDILNFSYSELGTRLPNGTYDIEFTLLSRPQGSSDDHEKVEGVDPLSLKVQIAMLAYKFSTGTPYTEVDGVVSGRGGDQEVVYWAFASQAAPEIKIEVENGSFSKYTEGFSVTVMPVGGQMPVAMEYYEIGESTESVSFRLYPHGMDDDGDGENGGIAFHSEEFLPDGNYVMSVSGVTEDDDYLDGELYVRIGTPPSYGFAAYGDHYEDVFDPWSPYVKFDIPVATFAVKAENVAAGWFAAVNVYGSGENGPDFDKVLATDTAREGDTIVSFSLDNGVYYGACTIYDADGTTLWTNCDMMMSSGSMFEIDYVLPEVTVRPVGNTEAEGTV
ncbi:MAG: hypothetical protein NC324_05605, partial [Bacteroides sp.]|nr:hypothetical protein [Bacteroides sp.]